MAIRIDPEGHELAALRRAASWVGLRVLEVGCGDGRLTLRLARLGAIVEAIDPDAEILREARATLPRRLGRAVRYRRGEAERLRYADEEFDAVVFSWSL